MPVEMFMIRALVAGLLLGPLCALLGVFVTARRMSFFSETVAHGAILGVALGVALGFQDLTLPVLVFSMGLAFLFVWLRERSLLGPDTLMALMLSGSISMGMILLSKLRGDFRGEIHRILFGDILSVGSKDLGIMLVLVVVVVSVLLNRLSALALMTANEELAQVCGISTRFLNYVFVALLTATVAVSVRLFGILLVTSLIVIPAAAARNLSHTLRQQILFSLAIGLGAAFGGVGLAYVWNTPCGPTIGLVCLLFFWGTLLMRAWTQRSY